MASLRATSIGAFVVAMAAQGDHAGIVRLTESGLWMPGDDDRCTAVAALLAAAPEGLHATHRRRALAAVLLGHDSTRARSVLRCRAFAVAFGRIFEDGRVDRDATLRLIVMGTPPKLLSEAIMRYVPEWSDEAMRVLATQAKLRRQSWRLPDDFVDIVRSSSRPGTLLRIAWDAFGHDPEHVFRRHQDAANDVAMLERLADDGDFMAWRQSSEFVRRILNVACDTDSERILGALEEPAVAEVVRSLRWSSREAAAHMDFKTRCPHLAERLDMLRFGGDKADAYGLADFDAERLRTFAVNYNVLRIMSGLGGLSYTS